MEFASRFKQGDVVPWIAHPDHCTESGKLRWRGAAAIEAVHSVGLLVLAAVGGEYPIAVAGEEASVVGIVVTDKEVTEAIGNVTPQATDDKYTVVVRGPAIVDIDKLADRDDPAGGSWDKAALATRLEALGFSIRKSA